MGSTLFLAPTFFKNDPSRMMVFPSSESFIVESFSSLEGKEGKLADVMVEIGATEHMEFVDVVTL